LANAIILTFIAMLLKVPRLSKFLGCHLLFIDMFDHLNAKPKAISCIPWQLQSVRASHEALHYGVAGGVYTVVKAGSQRLRGVDDWKNAIIGGAVAGAVYGIMDSRSKNDYKKLLHHTVSGACIAIGGEILTNFANFYS
jgi:hypothetical protein